MSKAIKRPSANFDRMVSKSAGHRASASKKVVSMFSGCGGMDLGFVGGFKFHGQVYKRLPFEIVWANELDVVACATYQLNLKHEIHCGDVNLFLDTLPNQADVLIGGFPCQDISINGNMAANEGSRSTLYRVMLDAIGRTKPKIFVAENVKGILMSHSKDLYDEMMRGFDNVGYNVTEHLYLAADYGVPQMRERVLFVGTRKSARRFEHPSPQLTQPEWLTTAAAIGDLADSPADEATSHIWSQAKASKEQGRRTLTGGRPSTTIRAECHGNQQFHYKLPRRISLREAARLQSFPDKFTFVGGMRNIERQVGNAVPPVLAWHIARTVQEYLK